jgi:hypothetical protein
MARYLDTYDRGQLVSSELQTELLDVPRRGTLTLRVAPDLQGGAVRWDVDNGDRVVLRTDQTVGGSYRAAAGSGALPADGSRTAVRNGGVVLYTVALSETEAVEVRPMDNDRTVQLRLVLTSNARSWVKAENTLFTWHLTDDVRRAELFAEIYVDGELAATDTLLNLSGEELQRELSFSAALGMSEEGVYGWYYGTRSGKTESFLPSALSGVLPAEDWTGPMLSLWPTGDRMALQVDRAIPLLAQTLWQADRSVDAVSGYPVNGTAEEQAEAVAQEDTVVAVLKLRVSGGETAGEGA